MIHCFFFCWVIVNFIHFIYIYTLYIMSKYFEEEQLNKYLNNQDKPNKVDKDGKMSKLDYIIFKIEQIERIVKRLDKQKSIKYNSD